MTTTAEITEVTLIVKGAEITALVDAAGNAEFFARFRTGTQRKLGEYRRYDMRVSTWTRYSVSLHVTDWHAAPVATAADYVKAAEYLAA
jgi:hypothetical protein